MTAARRTSERLVEYRCATCGVPLPTYDDEETHVREHPEHDHIEAQYASVTIVTRVAVGAGRGRAGAEQHDLFSAGGDADDEFDPDEDVR